MTTHHYRGTDGVLVVFDVSNPASLSAVPKWLGEVRAGCTFERRWTLSERFAESAAWCLLPCSFLDSGDAGF